MEDIDYPMSMTGSYSLAHTDAYHAAYSANALIRKKAEQAAAELAAARGPAASTARTTYTGEMPESQERPKGRDASFSKGFSNGVHVLRR